MKAVDMAHISSRIGDDSTPLFAGGAERFSIGSVGSVAYRASDRQPPEVSRHLPPFDSFALALAGEMKDHAAIDRITDKLVIDGLARARHDTSMLEHLRAGLRVRFGGRK